MPRNSLFLLLLRKADQDRYMPLIRDQIEALRTWVLEHVKEQG